MERARWAGPDDLPEVLDLAREAVQVMRAQRGGPVWTIREARPEPFEADLVHALAGSAGRRVAVGLIDDAVVGYATMHPERLHDGSQLAVVTDLYVTPGARGVGVGEALMDLLIDAARADGEVVLRVDGADLALTVQGIYESSDFIPARTYHRDTFVDTSIVTPAGIVSLTRAAGVSDSQFRAAVDTVVEAYGIGTLQDKREFIDSRADIVDRSLAFIYGLLLLSIMIATFGIVITLLLAVYERRRETGLLRAVGMTRAQVRTTVRWESVGECEYLSP